MLQIGAHMSIGKGFLTAFTDSKDVVGGTALQIFTKNPRGRESKPLNPEDVAACQEFQKENNFFAAAHCSYLLNFAKSFTTDPWPNESLIDDLRRIDAVGGHAVVLHIGKQLELSEDEAKENIVKNIHIVLEKTKDLKTMILLENTAGQGTEIGYRFEQLGGLIKAINHPRVHVCMDTCHAFASGYDLTSEEGAKETFGLFDEHIGLEHLKMFHLNDAKKEQGSRVDRHEDIAMGKIGLEGILAIARFAEKNNIPCILETPAEHATYTAQIEQITKHL